MIKGGNGIKEKNLDWIILYVTKAKEKWKVNSRFAVVK
jgi:hypothetical protein